jgi:hypothetical protein
MSLLNFLFGYEEPSPRGLETVESKELERVKRYKCKFDWRYIEVNGRLIDTIYFDDLEDVKPYLRNAETIDYNRYRPNGRRCSPGKDVIVYITDLNNGRLVETFLCSPSKETLKRREEEAMLGKFNDNKPKLLTHNT